MRLVIRGIVPCKCPRIARRNAGVAVLVELLLIILVRRRRVVEHAIEEAHALYLPLRLHLCKVEIFPEVFRVDAERRRLLTEVCRLFTRGLHAILIAVRARPSIVVLVFLNGVRVVIAKYLLPYTHSRLCSRRSRQEPRSKTCGVRPRLCRVVRRLLNVRGCLLLRRIRRSRVFRIADGRLVNDVSPALRRICRGFCEHLL